MSPLIAIAAQAGAPLVQKILRRQIGGAAGELTAEVIGQIAAGSDLSAITQAPLYLLVGALVLVVHIVIMLIYAKIAKVELFSLAVSSTANIGGVASAPVVAAAYNKELVPVGVLMALIGSFAGTFLGLGAAQLMSVL